MWLDPDTSAEFWDFSFQDIGEYDSTAAIEFIQKERASDQKVIMFGYS